MHDLEHCDYYFVDLLYEKFYKEVEAKRKQEEKENAEREKEISYQQQMQEQQSRMMSNFNNYTHYNNM